jgi:hypothetical protein
MLGKRYSKPHYSQKRGNYVGIRLAALHCAKIEQAYSVNR